VVADLVEFSAGICVGERGFQLTAGVGILERVHGIDPVLVREEGETPA
jgi:hypothetical protein